METNKLSLQLLYWHNITSKKEWNRDAKNCEATKRVRKFAEAYFVDFPLPFDCGNFMKKMKKFISLHFDGNLWWQQWKLQQRRGVSLPNWPQQRQTELSNQNFRVARSTGNGETNRKMRNKNSILFESTWKENFSSLFRSMSCLIGRAGPVDKQEGQKKSFFGSSRVWTLDRRVHGCKESMMHWTMVAPLCHVLDRS